MKEPKITLSKKHGLNPAIPKCFYCGQDKNEIILAGKMKGDQQAPQGMIWDEQPCDKCMEFMKEGVILISVNEQLTTDVKNPYRTGGFAVVREEMIRRLVQPQQLAKQIIKRRVAFIPDEVWHAIGLPPIHGEEK